MKIYHEYNGDYHEIIFTNKDFIFENGTRSEQIPGTFRSTGQFGSIEYTEKWDYKDFPKINSYVICLICKAKVLINSCDK